MQDDSTSEKKTHTVMKTVNKKKNPHVTYYMLTNRLKAWFLEEIKVYVHICSTCKPG